MCLQQCLDACDIIQYRIDRYPPMSITAMSIFVNLRNASGRDSLQTRRRRFTCVSHVELSRAGSTRQTYSPTVPILTPFKTTNTKTTALLLLPFRAQMQVTVVPTEATMT